MAALAFGHKNPDTDTVVSALAAADLKTKTGTETKAVTLGECPPETVFVLEKFGIAKPEVVTSVAGQDVVIVDTTDLSQLPDDIAEANVLAIYDHHKLGSLTTTNPLEMWVGPVGSTATMLYMAYQYNNVEIPKDLAGAMLCALLSDTVMFKSPTCTDKDKEVADELAKIAGIGDMMDLGMEMFKVKSAVDDATAEELVFRDYKDFDMSGKKVGIGQLEVVDLSMLEPRKAELAEQIKKVKAEGRHSVFLLLTDIMKEGSAMLIVSDDASVVEKAFGVAGDTEVWLDGVMSRKKQVVPNFEKAFASL
ncbi:manganese-dependent inorganic pyrophosphatase [Oceanidesulfovibrio indonesiensis]|uniref:inorganic diphosphatase n=1 Tax=Oceanidesulfovibrio indonesiensis TaxID=54767 RepID=A0A7M3MG78_9BACT|nr:manganese-dependent inorganic pyrophosphatase [Oceanidesulfovibrio indonesiensis]TVM18324.1 manganese-dependent inorganic pyrophosphatase [Oceanidesulfovibrio indonesiensis]